MRDLKRELGRKGLKEILNLKSVHMELKEPFPVGALDLWLVWAWTLNKGPGTWDLGPGTWDLIFGLSINSLTLLTIRHYSFTLMFFCSVQCSLNNC